MDERSRKSHDLQQVNEAMDERSKKSHDLQQINEEMDAIKKEANQIKMRRILGEEQQPRHRAEPLMQSGETATAVVGLDVELNQLLDELTGYQPSRRIISIVGMGGTGKTILAKNVYENSLIKENFQFRAWVTVSQQNNALDVLLKLLSGLGESSDGKINELGERMVNEIGERLHKTLSCRRYLIVLDDIWSVKAWDEVRRFFPDKKNRSRILLTTRLSNVAKDCGSSLFMLNLLDEENSWELFCQKAFKDEDFPPELLEVGKEIVRLCKGLALSIVVIGGLLLKSPKNIGHWKAVAKALKSIPDSKEKQESLDVLSLSYNHLPPHLKPCFLYMGVFKEDTEIRVSKIIKLWIAEGFIKPIGSQALEEIAESYIKDLFDRNLILFGKRRKYGKFGSCSIHDLLRDLCIKIAEQQQFFHAIKNSMQGTERHLVHHWYLESTKVEFPLARCIIVENHIMDLIKYRLLRVLDAGTCYSQEDYHGNVNLRYVAYERHYDFPALWKLPSSVSLMWNLQTLAIKAFGTLVVAPTELWKMQQLRHIECVQIYLPCPLPSNAQDELLLLENLQTLKRVLNMRLCEELCKIIPNIKKLHLDYDHDLHGYCNSLSECVFNLDRLRKLESLSLSMCSSTQSNLNNELNRKLATSLPSSLKRLSLLKCGLYWEDLEAIGLLPYLEVLKLDQSVKMGSWNSIDGQFRRLKFLEIKSCDLVCWDADASHFPILEMLHLERLESLEEIPLGIGDVPTLELIHVRYCSNSSAISAVKIKEEQIEMSDGLQVQVMLLYKDKENFNQMLEMEELTTNNIQLPDFFTST